MLTEHDLIRKNLYSRLGIETRPRRDPSMMSAEIRQMTSKLDEIVAQAKPRLIMGEFATEVIGNMMIS